MNNWLADPPSIANTNHAGFAPAADPSMAFLQPNSTIDPSQFQHQRFLNGGGARNSSPAFHNPFPQPNPVIPSKRPREDSLVTSPRQAPGGLPAPRSQTPGQVQYAGYNPASNGTPHFQNAPTPFQHLQAGAASTASPSPTPQSHVFPQHAGQQRVATASPSPFSPHHHAPHMSPAHSDQASRVGTPHDNPNGYLQSGHFGQQFNQAQFAQGIVGVNNHMPMNPQLNLGQPPMQQGLSSQQRVYQMQIQAQARQLQAQAAQGRPSSSGMGQMGNPNVPMQNPQMASMQQMQQNARSQITPETFARGLQLFMEQKRIPVNVNPVICGRPLNLMQLFFYIVKAGGSGKITKLNQWPVVAQQFGFPTSHMMPAAQELRDYWSRNVLPYETAWVAKQHRQGQQVRNASGDFDAQHQLQNQMSPNKHHFAGPEFGSHPRDTNTMKLNGSNPPQPVNGYTPPTQLKDQSRQQPTTAQHRTSSSRQMDGKQLNGVATQYPPTKKLDTGQGKMLEVEAEAQMPRKQAIEDPFKPEVLPGNETRMHGPINVEEMISITNSLLDLKPVIPTFRELGTIDIHALNMSIKSGILAEVRLALDTLTTISLDSTTHLSLDACDDLVESLVDCAQEQVDLLAKHATEVSDEMLISSYEHVMRSCRLESESLQDVHEMGSVEYDLDRAVDRLICITTLIRNFSFYETNFGLLGMPEVVRLLTSVVKYIGTKEMFLRSHRNTLDFMKDVIIYLSNLSHSIQLPGKDEALCLLHFLLSFAPCPHPVSSTSEGVVFASYDPNIHKYTPSAVDSLAKLLARDEPNRSYYKAIFAADGTSSPPYELLTRTFGLAIAPIPSSAKGAALALVETRKPFLLQGMLAAEILSNLAPGSEAEVARSWLSSSDGFAVTLLKLVLQLASVPRPPRPPSRHSQQRNMYNEADADAISAIMHRGIAVLRRLAEKSRTSNSEHGEVRLPLGVVPKKENLVGALMSKDIDPYVMRQLCMYAGLED
jgi:SWI/SNF chromatin-remodeling complex subunit SWI1